MLASAGHMTEKKRPEIVGVTLREKQNIHEFS